MSSSSYSPLANQDEDEARRPMLSVSPDRIVSQKVGRPTHRMVVFLHTVFKLLALLLYIGSSLLTNSFVACFITAMLLLSADFWLVKNVSGRLLAGLRWWSVVNDEGELNWKYESWSQEERSLAQSGEANYFWASLISAQVLWLLFAFIALFSLALKWLLLCCLALSLNGANLLGYTRARLGQAGLKERVTGWVAATVLRRPPKQQPSQTSS